MKKLLLFFLLIFLIIPIKVIAVEDGGTYNGASASLSPKRIDWHYKDGILTFSTNDDKTYYEIPKDIANNWSKYQNNVTKIVIEEGIDVINNNAFENYSNLEEIVFPKSMGGLIGDYAFYNCSKLKSIELPTSLTRIGDYAFYGTGIEEVELSIYLDWTYEHTFNENTTITRPAEYDDIIAAGTSGNVKRFSENGFDNGLPTNGTCYNKFYYSEFYDDTGHWILYNDGTLVISGSELMSGFYGSRNPWGCYKEQIKKVIFNDDKEGSITVNDKICNNNSHVKLAIYTSKSVEEIMQNRIKVLDNYYFADVRVDSYYGYRNLETVIINRGVEEIKNSALNTANAHPDNIFVNKYVKSFYHSNVFQSFNPQYREGENNLHLSISYEDYKNNGYKYYYAWNEETEFFREDGTLKEVEELRTSNYDNFKGNLINDVDDTYVSINDNSAPDTIEVEGKTYYKYETYLTNENGIANISIPNDPTIDYVVKEIEVPEGCTINNSTYKINMEPKVIDLLIEINPEIPKESTQANPLTKDNVMVLLVLFGLSIILIIYNYRKGHELL